MTTTPGTPPKFYEVARGSAVSACSCGARRAFTVVLRKDGTPYSMPVDFSGPGTSEPTSERDGLGTNHWIVCPDAELHRKRKPRRAKEAAA